MFKKIFYLCILAVASAYAGTYLIQVDLGPERINEFIDQGIDVIAELEHSAIALVPQDKLATFSNGVYQILDENAIEGDYYLVRATNEQFEPHIYGSVLFQEEQDLLLKIDPAMFEQLIGQQVHVKKLFFRPIVQSAIVPSIPQVRFDQNIQDIVDLVDPDTILSIVQRLQDFKSRYSTYDSCFAAGNWIRDKFLSYGVDSVFFQYHTGGHAPNVIAVKRGVLYPDSIYTVICGHYDAITYYGPDIAPGADDNASGTANVIEAARVTKDYQFEFSIRYMAFSGEEFGLYGSEYYAYHAHNDGDSIRGVFNGDMIGYIDVQPESIEVIGKLSNPSCDWLADFLIASADTYATVLTRKRLTNNWIPSDNQSFLDYGYPALLEIEDYGVTNPHYHSPSDTIGAGYNANDFCTEVSKAQIAAISIMAVPYVTGIVEERSETVPLSMTVYPSITGSQFTISLNTHDLDNALIMIHDVLGRTIAHYPKADVVVWNGHNDQGKRVPAGVYFVRAHAGGQIVQEKILLLR